MQMNAANSARALTLIAALLACSSVFAQTPSGSANGKTCSQLVQECVAFNKKGGHDTSRCAGYKAPCMESGTYQDRNRTITGVVRK
jgi:hypothetical protein